MNESRTRGIEDVEAGQLPEDEGVVIVRLGEKMQPVNRDAAEDLRDQLNAVLDD